MKRRGNSEGCITKDSRGKWIARLQIGYNSNGNPRIKTFSGNTPTEARRRMNNFKKNLANMDGLTKADGLMSEGLRYWSDKYKKTTLKPSSYDRLMQTIEYQIIPYIGNYMIQKVSPTIFKNQSSIACKSKAYRIAVSRRRMKLLMGFSGNTL